MRLFADGLDEEDVVVVHEHVAALSSMPEQNLDKNRLFNYAKIL
jgi:hypothetical protein